MERLRWITGALLLGLLLCAAAAAEDAPRTIQICLQEEIPGNAPYVKDGRSYRRDIAVPLLEGTPGALYKKTTQVCSWLFSVGGGYAATLKILPRSAGRNSSSTNRKSTSLVMIPMKRFFLRSE